MSLKIMTWVFHESKARGIDKLVLLAIADHAHDDGASAYPGMRLLADKAGVGVATVCRAVERLSELGELEVTDRQTTAKAGAKIGRGSKLSYRIIVTGKVPERNNKKVPERNNPKRECSADDAKNVPLTTPPIEEEPSLSKNRKSVPPAAAAKNGDQPTTQTLLAEFLDALGAEYANKGRLATQIQRALKLPRTTPDEVRNGLLLMVKKGKVDPSILFSMIDETRLNGNGHRVSNGRYVNDDRWKPATTPRRAYGQDYTPEQKAELDRLLEEEWAGRQVLGHNLPGRTP